MKCNVVQYKLVQRMQHGRHDANAMLSNVKQA
uniref:Uncharacterized protein n=1 Tax=Arundo donax TaxID=35708 RepID=A0A0A8ZW52_ARUDO